MLGERRERVNFSMTGKARAKFERTLANLLRARFPYLYVATWEEARALQLITVAAKNIELIRTERRVLDWSLTNGFTENGIAVEGDTKQPLKALDFIENFEDPAVFVLKDFHVFLGGAGRPADSQVVRRLRDLVPAIKHSQRPKNVVFIAPSLVLPNELEKDVTVLEFELPSFGEIRDVLSQMIETNRATGRVAINVTEEDEERLAKAAMGLTLHEAENAFARAMVEDGKLDISDVEVVLEEKRQTIRKSGILEYIKPDLNIKDVGGLQNLKRWLVKRNKSWLDSAARYNLPAPRGVLITGVPGCGKSLVAKAVSAMWQVPLLRLDVGRIFSGVVGSSEENMRRAIETAEAISPCVLWIDEVEKGFGSVTGPSGDSGTSARIFGTFLTWMQEKSKPVFVVATANNISALPPEMMRKGRFDEIFFVDLPTHSEREEIIKLHLDRRLTDASVRGEFVSDKASLASLAEATEGFVGAELEQVVVSGLFEAFYENRSVSLNDFLKAVRFTVPLSVTQAEQIQHLREWANVRAVAATQEEDRTAYETSKGGPQPSDQSRASDAIISSRGGRSIDF
jgi:SpoVK/Ycf46/Vps4 family AAA+-type ATPase